ncbi:MAG: Lrp/AsnC ligand binding domain-containing protein [Bacteroidales bacterium]|nr:Lrp/AsnC ligand binding domain-containing protein [Bacteroidales bacterium]
MLKNYHIDGLDKRILSFLTADARIPFLEIARRCRVSGAAIHQRIQKMKEGKVISGSQYNISPVGLGYNTCAFIGIQINLTSQSTHEEVFKKIMEIDEIVECHHISGKYSLFVKVFTKTNEHLKKIIIDKIQAIPEITFTETFISLEEGFVRQLPVDG